MSYDSFSRPYKFYESPKVDSHHIQFSSYGYYELTGFWLEQVVEITRELTLIPPVIKCRSTGCVAPKDLAIFWRWHKPGNWKAHLYRTHLMTPDDGIFCKQLFLHQSLPQETHIHHKIS
jgi:hypothetical protein